MATAPHHYEKGKMEISGHRATFATFWWWTQTAIIFIAITLILMASFLT